MVSNSTIKYDIVVVGAGPAGLCAGISAAKEGCKVLIIERRSEIGSPIRTSGGSWIAEMQEFNIPASLYNPISKITFRSSNEEASFSSNPPQNCVLNVRGLYQYLAEQALNLGAKISVRTSAKELILQNSDVKGVTIVKFSERKHICADVVIDASGYSCFSYRDIGIKVPDRFAEGVEYELYAPHFVPNESFLFVGGRICKSGYGWIFPCGNSRARIGVGIIKPDNPQDPISVLNKFISTSNLIEGSREIEFHHGFLPCWGYLTKNVFNGLIIIGDAAGHLPLLVGEGIRFAMKSGLVAGRVAAEAVKNSDPSEKRLSTFKKEWLDKELLSFKTSLYINKKISQFNDEQWDKGIRYLSKIKSDYFFRLLRSNFSVPLIFGLAATNSELLKQLPKVLIKKLF
jgi:digeranylgeranylglycerophospholipid reductase